MLKVLELQGNFLEMLDLDIRAPSGFYIVSFRSGGTPLRRVQLAGSAFESVGVLNLGGRLSDLSGTMQPQPLRREPGFSH